MDTKNRDETDWDRPSVEVADAVWDLLAGPLHLRIRDFFRRSPRLNPDDRPGAVCTAKQSLVIALACFVQGARLRKIVRVNDFFDALAWRWSPHFRQARKASGATTGWDMLPVNVKAAVGDLVRAGLRVDVLWRIATSKRNPLYIPEMVPFLGYQVRPPKNEETLKDFERLVGTPLGTRTGRRLLLDSERTPRRRRQRKIAGEREYNIVEVGPRAERVCTLQEQVRVRFNVDAFLADYERAQRNVRALTALLPSKWQDLLERSPVERRHTKTKTLLPSARDVATKKRIRVKRIRQAVRGLFPLYDAARRITTDFWHIERQVRGLVASGAILADDRGRYLIIKSGFNLQINHRYQWQHFWPPSVTAQQDQSSQEVYQFQFQVLNEDMTPKTPEIPFEERRNVETSPRGRWFEFLEQVNDGDPYGHHRLGGLDISSSQTQILAVLIGIPDLEEQARKESFKKYLATEAWRRHTDPKDPFTLRSGTDYIRNYDGPDDERLIELVKELWLRRLYGGDVRGVIRDQRKKPGVYGPGWTYDNAFKFLTDIPWYMHVDMFLRACQKISHHMDPYKGVIFIDPLDQIPIRWHHAQRTKILVPFGDQKLTVLAPGTKGVLATERRGQYPVNLRKLRQVIAPCLTQLVDSFFCSLVIERLAAHGIQNFVAVHDCFMIPTDPNVLREIFDDAAQEWLSGLGPIYEKLWQHLGQDPEFKDFVQEMRRQWRARLARKDWPVFRAGEDAPTKITELAPPLIRTT